MHKLGISLSTAALLALHQSQPSVTAADDVLRGRPTQKLRSGTIRNVGATRRNQPCPCGSGRKFKRCCLPAAS